jgi:hypothetical protein
MILLSKLNWFSRNIQKENNKESNRAIGGHSQMIDPSNRDIGGHSQMIDPHKNTP